jgi:hypothetical protein
MEKVDLKQCKKISLGVITFWYEEKEDGALWLVAFQVFNNRFRFFVPKGAVTTITENEDGDILEINVDE